MANSASSNASISNNLEAGTSSNLNGNIIAYRSHLLKKCDRPVTPEPFKGQEKPYVTIKLIQTKKRNNLKLLCIGQTLIK